MSLLLAAALACAACALAACALAVRARGRVRTLGLGERIVAADVGHPAFTPAPSLRDPVRGVRGKPDFLVVLGRGLAWWRGPRVAAVELKPLSRSTRAPNPWDEVQATAYGVMLQATRADAADTAYLRTGAATWRIPLTRARLRTLDRVLAGIRHGRTLPVVRRDHRDTQRCARCPVRRDCPDALA